MICERCGKVHAATNGRACRGHVKLNGPDGEPLYDADGQRSVRPCTKNAMTGLDVCASHGGRNPSAKAAGQARATEQKAAAVLRRFGEPMDTTPTEALLDAVKWTAGYVAWLRDKVAEADEDKALTQRSTQTGKREASVWVDLLGQWHDRLVRICSEAIKAGIEERRVRIAEQQGALVADVIRKILDRLELTPEQQGKAGEVVPFELRRLAG